METLNVNLKENSYPIYIEKGLRHNFVDKIKGLFKGKKVVVISDDNVYGYYGEVILDALSKAGYEANKIVIKAGEKSKSFNTLPIIYNSLLDMGITRSDLIITLGGGVVGDLGGFAASTYLRGIPFIQFPTSLLAQVDSSVGGKVAVDLEKGKNLVGSFYHPLAVIIDPEMLNTLSDRFLYDGMAEVIKYGCIKDKELFNNLLSYKNKEELMENIEYVIKTSCDIKRQVVEKDEKDKGDRMLLNFGHTLGHAIEKYYNFEGYSHGEAVAIGMYVITKLSEEKGITKEGTANKIKEIVEKYNLPYNPGECSKNELISAMKVDKKNLNNVLNLILIKEIGKSFIEKSNVSFFENM